jgi:hypothetical protein
VPRCLLAVLLHLLLHLVRRLPCHAQRRRSADDVPSIR